MNDGQSYGYYAVEQDYPGSTVLAGPYLKPPKARMDIQASSLCISGVRMNYVKPRPKSQQEHVLRSVSKFLQHTFGTMLFWASRA